MDHITDEDVSSTRDITDAATAHALRLLDLPDHGRVRASLAKWKQVDELAAALEGAGNGLSGRVSDSEGLGCVPTPRDGTEANEGDL